MNRPPFLVQRIRSAKVMVRYSAAAAICGLALGCTDVTSAGPPPVVAAPRSVTPSRLVPVGPTDFSGVAGTSVPRGPVVRVLGDNEVPAVGVEVAFTGERSKVVVTDASGIAEFGPLQLDSVAGNQFIDAQVRVAPDKALSVRFDLHSVVGPLVSLIPAAGNNQRGEPRTALVNQLFVKATDVYNNPISGVEVKFDVESGGGSVEMRADTTDQFGLVSAGKWTLGNAGAQRVSARVGTLETVFKAEFCADVRGCSTVPSNLAFVRDGGVWINGVSGPVLFAENARRPSWSADGARLAFFRVNERDEDVAICVASPPAMTVACAPVDILSREIVSEMRAAWAPDGRTLALSRLYYGPGDSQLLFLDVGSMTIRRHGTIDRGVLSVSWSPNGERLVIASSDRVYLANAAGSDLKVLLDFPVWEVAWSPDGGKLGVITLGCGWECYGVDIGLVDVQTKQLQVLVRGTVGFSSLAWSPDATHLAYGAGDYAMREIRVTAIANGSTEVVLSNSTDPSWHP